MGFSQKVLPELEASVSESLVITLPLSLPVSPSHRAGCSQDGDQGRKGVVLPSLVVCGSWLCSQSTCSAQGKAEQQKLLWCFEPSCLSGAHGSASGALLPEM